MGTEITDFLCGVLNTILSEKAVDIADLDGYVLSERNNYLLSEDGKEFVGLATLDTGEVVEFTIFEKSDGCWAAELPCGQVA